MRHPIQDKFKLENSQRRSAGHGDMKIVSHSKLTKAWLSTARININLPGNFLENGNE